MKPVSADSAMAYLRAFHALSRSCTDKSGHGHGGGDGQGLSSSSHGYDKLSRRIGSSV